MITAKQLLPLPAIAVIAYLASSIDQWLFASYDVIPLYGQLVCLGGLLGYLAITMVIGEPPRVGTTRAQIAVFAIFLAYLSLTAVSFLYSRQSPVETDILTDRLRGGMFLIFFAIVLSEPLNRSYLAFATALLALLGGLLNLYDFVVPTFSTVPGRAAGFYQNPNEAGFMLVFLATIAGARLPVLLNYLLWAIVSLAVLLTFSRGAWIMLILAMLGHVYLGYFGGGRARFVFVGLVCALMLAVLVSYLSGDLYLLAVNSPLADYLDGNTLARLGSRGVALDDNSAIEREYVIDLGIRYFLDSPIVGWGVGATHVWAERASTHNMVILLAAELGVLGVVCYLAIFAILIVRAKGNARLLSVLLFVSGMFTHNQLDFLTNIVALAFCIGSLASTAPRRSPVNARRPAIASRAAAARLP